MKIESPGNDDVDMEKQQLKRALALADKRLSEISQLSYDIIQESKSGDLDIYDKAYRINQCAPDAIRPIRTYCLDDNLPIDN